MNNRENSEKIRLKEKAAFGMANLGNIPIMTLVGSYLLIFYTDVAGINPAAVATLFIVARVLDGVNDPIMGFIIDHLPKSKMGRFRPYLILGVILCSINYLLLWFGPLLLTEIKLIIVYVTYLLIGITFDLMDIPLNAMIPVMTEDEKERASLSTIKGACYMAGMLGIGIVAPLILNNAGSKVTGYLILVGGATAIVLIFSIIGTLGIQERIQPIEEEKYKLKQLLPVLGQRPIMISFAVSLLFGIGGTVANSSNIYFVTYVLDNRLDVLSIVSFISMAGMFLGMFVAGKLIGRLGKRAVYGGSLILYGVFLLIRILNVTSIPLIYISSLLAGIGSGGIMTLSYGIQADNVDYIEYKKGMRAEGALASLNSFVVKAGQGIGGAIPGYILAATGYAANQAQTDSAIGGIVTATIIIPALIYVAGGVIFGAGYNLDKSKLAEIMQKLRDKRAEKAHKRTV